MFNVHDWIPIKMKWILSTGRDIEYGLPLLFDLL